MDKRIQKFIDWCYAIEHRVSEDVFTEKLNILIQEVVEEVIGEDKEEMGSLASTIGEFNGWNDAKDDSRQKLKEILK